MNGKSKCKILKDIRRRIAEENNIDFITSECKFQGECSGTCPKCEAEVRYLEAELSKRQKAGKAVAVAGIAAALLVGTTGCGINDLFIEPHGGDVPAPVESQTQTTAPTSETEDLMGEPPQTNPTSETEDLLAGVPVEPMGTMPIPSEDETEPVLMGDMPMEYVDGVGNLWGED